MSVRLAFFVMSVLASFQTYASFWENLWITPDQKGQRLMKKGQYSLAKETFKNQPWSATAAYRAGDFETANRQFQALGTEQGYYNQGNALAYLGKYQAAIAAYDKALALNPNNQDARDNRELLKNLMKQNKNDQKKDGQDQEKQNKNDQKKDGQDQEKQNKNDQKKDGQDQEKQNKDDQKKDGQDQEKQNKDDQKKDGQDQEKQNKDDQKKDGQDQEKQNKDEPKKGENDKEKGNSKPNQGQEPEPKEASQSAADREKQQAKDQWLQLIPDDPGGLLREKFLRDHLRRQRGWNQ